MKILSLLCCVIVLSSCNVIKITLCKGNLNSYDEIDTSYICPSIDYTFNRSSILKIYYKELIDSLNNDHVPDYLYNECIDSVAYAYCHIGLEETVSLRYDLINDLSFNLLSKLTVVSDSNLLKKICQYKSFNNKIKFYNVSTLDMIKNRMGEYKFKCCRRFYFKFIYLL